MSNDLAEFFGTLLRIARWILDVTLTLICSALLLAASLLPWRIPFICKDLVETSTSPTFKKFQTLAVVQFLLSLVDVLLFIWLLPSFLWPLRWPALCLAVRRAQDPPRDDDDDDEDQHRHGYNMLTRVDFFLKGLESYLDFFLLPFVLLLSVVPWRWCLRIPKLRSSFQLAKRCEDPCERISAVRNWAASNGFNGLLDLPFVVLGLSSLLVPTQCQAFIFLLFRRDLDPETADCEVRIYLAVLPLLSLCDFFVAIFALLALGNPLRCGRCLQLMSSKWGNVEKTGCFSAKLQEFFHWNAGLRAVAMRSGLASLLDLLLLPLGLVVCITVYRAGPLVSEICRRRDGAGADGGLAALNEDELPLSKIHQMTLKQSTLLLCDLLTLPSLLVVYWSYRYPFVQPLRDDLRKSWGPVAHHVAVFLNSLVLLHDLLLALCTLPVLLTMYRVPKVFRLLHQRASFRPASEHPEVADLVPALEVAACGRETRVRLWQEIGHLLLDLPLLPALLIVICSLWRADLVLQQCWSAEDNCQRRKAVVLQFLELLRDLLAFVALLLVCVTLFRMPKVLLDIYSQRARPVAGVPRFLLQRVSVLVGAGRDQRLLVRADAVQEEARSVQEIGAIRINVISKTFWDEIAHIFGTSVASLGKALLPFTLKDGKHVKYSDFLPQEANIELRLGGRELKSKLLQLEGSIAMCVQLEHREPSGGNEILTRLPIPAHLLQQAVNQPGEVVEIPEELLRVAPETVCGDLLSGAGIRNAMWLCALSEFWQLILDLVHLLLFIFQMLAPWRLLQCIYFACRPSQVWHGTLARKVSSLLLVKEAVLKQYRRQLEPELNAAAKDPPQRTSQKLRDLAAELLSALPLPSQASEAALLAELETQPGPEAASFVKTVKSYSFLQNAVSSYWPGLKLGANLQLANQSFSPQEHALAIEKISNAQSRADDLLLNMLAEVQAGSLEFSASTGGGPLSNACGKPLLEHRRLVQVFAYEVLKDYGTLLLGLLLLLSMYRLPAVLRGLRQERQADFVQRLRIVLNCQVRLLMWDIWMFFTALLATILAIITLVRALEFLRKAFLHCGSLADLRREALGAAKDAITSLWELLILMTFWDTYKTLVYASIFSLLLPAWGLIPLPIWMRIVFWLALCSLPFLLPSALYALCTFGLVVAVFFLFALVKRGPCGTSASPAYLKSLRMTGMNAVVLLSIVLDASLLCSIHYVEAFLQKDTCFYVAIAVTVAWLVVLSMPHAMSSDDTCLKSGKFHVSLQLLRRCVLPSALVFLAQLNGPVSRWCCLLLAFLSFSSILGLDLLSQDHLPESIGLDLLQAPSFTAGFTFLQTLFAALSMGATEEWAELLPFVVGLLMPLWVIVFQCWGGIGGPLWLLPLHLGTSIMVLSFALVRSIPDLVDGGVVVLTLFAVTMVSMVACECWAQKQRRKAMEKAGVAKVLHQILEKLSKKGLSLESHQRVPICDTLSPQSVAKELEAFEDSTRMEGLSTSFLEQRKEWLNRLRLGRGDYEVVAECGHQLLEAVCTPPSNLQIFLLLRRKSGRRIPSAIWQMILEYVSDVRYVSRMLTPVVNHFGSGGPGRQLLRAWGLMDTLGQRASDAANATGGEAQAASAMPIPPRKGVTVTVDAMRGGLSWRGRVVGTARNGVQVAALAPLQRQKFRGFTPLDRIRVEKQTLQERIDEDLQLWWKEAIGAFGDGCSCGRPLPPSTRRGCWHCFRQRKYHFCCQSCESDHPNHSDSCNARAARFKDLSGPRHLSSGCRAVDVEAIVEANVGSAAINLRDTE